MWGRCMEVGLLKENSERFHESISKNLFDYMELTNHFILVKLSLMVHNDKVYNTEIDTCVSLNNLALNSIDLGNFLKCYHDKNIIFWTFLNEGQTDSLFVNHDVKVTHQNVGDFVYLQLSKEDDDVNNDGKVDSTDKYLKKRRQAIGKAMKKESVDSIRAMIQKELKNI